MKARPFVCYWMPVIIWMLIIFGASTDLGSAEHTSRFLLPFLHWLSPNLSGGNLVALEFVVRKLAHLTEYAVLALLLFRALRTFNRRAVVLQAGIVLVVAGLYAVTDEFHQSFNPSRTATAHDVMIDCCGAAVGIALYWILRRFDTRTAAPTVV